MRKRLKSYSLFQLIERKIFDELVNKWQIDKGVTKFSTWEMTCILISSFIYRLESYREVSQALGISRSTLGDALSKRSFGFFQDLCNEVLSQIRFETTSRKIRKAIREILAIDSTEMRVHGSLFRLHPLVPEEKFGL